MSDQNAPQPTQYLPPNAQQPPTAAQQPPSGPAAGYAVTTQPLTPTEERSWSTLAHVIPLIAGVFSAGTAGFIGSLVVYLMFRDRGPFVRRNAANSLNIQIVAAVSSIISWLLIVTVIGAIIGIPLLIATIVWFVVVHIKGAIAANRGEWYQPAMVPTLFS